MGPMSNNDYTEHLSLFKEQSLRKTKKYRLPLARLHC